MQCPPECWLHTQLGFRGASEEDGSILLFPWYEKPYCLPATSFNLWHRIYYFDLFLKKISCASEDHRSVLLCNYTMWTFILTFMNWFYVCLKSFSTTTEHHIEYCLKLLTDWVIWFGKSRNETVMRLYMTILWINKRDILLGENLTSVWPLSWSAALCIIFSVGRGDHSGQINKMGMENAH